MMGRSGLMVQDELTRVDQAPQGVGERRPPVGALASVVVERPTLALVGPARERAEKQLVEHLVVGHIGSQQLRQAAAPGAELLEESWIGHEEQLLRHRRRAHPLTVARRAALRKAEAP